MWNKIITACITLINFFSAKFRQYKLLVLSDEIYSRLSFKNDHVSLAKVSGLQSFAVCIVLALSDQSALTSSLRSCRPPVYHVEMGKSRYVLLPAAQQVNLPACSPHCFFNAERLVGKLRITVQKSLPSLQLERLLPLGHLSSISPTIKT